MIKYFRYALSYLSGFIKCLGLTISHGQKCTFGCSIRFFTSTIIEVSRQGELHLGRMVSVKQRSRLSVAEKGTLKIGNGVGINADVKIICHEKIEIGDDSIIAPGTIIVDHDHAMDGDGVDKKHFATAPIIIGKKCWIGANVVILKGTAIGDGAVIAAGCVVRGNVPAHSMLVQKRENVILQKKDV